MGEIDERIAELTGKIPVGTVCTDTNCCGGYLSREEADELEALISQQASLCEGSSEREARLNEENEICVKECRRGFEKDEK